MGALYCFAKGTVEFYGRGRAAGQGFAGAASGLGFKESYISGADDGEGKGMFFVSQTRKSSLRERHDFLGSAKKGRGHEALQQHSPPPRGY